MYKAVREVASFFSWPHWLDLNHWSVTSALLRLLYIAESIEDFSDLGMGVWKRGVWNENWLEGNYSLDHI